METFKLIITICSGIITLITLSTLLLKPLRDRLIEHITTKYEQAKKDDEQNELIEDVKKMVQDLSERFKNQLSEQEKNNERYEKNVNDMQECLKSILRNSITHLYYRYIPEDVNLPEYERQNLIFLYTTYSEILKGNSYVEHCYNELMEKPFVACTNNPHCQNLDEE